LLLTVICAWLTFSSIFKTRCSFSGLISLRQSLKWTCFSYKNVTDNCIGNKSGHYMQFFRLVNFHLIKFSNFSIWVWGIILKGKKQDFIYFNIFCSTWEYEGVRTPDVLLLPPWVFFSRRSNQRESLPPSVSPKLKTCAFLRNFTKLRSKLRQKLGF